MAVRLALEGVNADQMADKLVTLAEEFGEVESGYADKMKLVRACSMWNLDAAKASELGNKGRAIHQFSRIILISDS
jgi:hypothetical protein